MATNNNGHLVDDKGNVVVDFVWGNFPLQPNDDRVEPNLLDWSLDNHIIADSGYNGYPLYVPNTRGADTSTSVDYILVPSVLGKTTALAIDALEDAGFATKAGVNTITSNTGTTAKALTRVDVTSTTVAVVYLANANTLFTVGSKVKIAAGTSIPAAVVNTTTGWEVTASDATTVTIKGTGFTVADTGTIAPAATVTGASGTVTYQSIVANTASVAPGTAITITAWA